jgi:DNA-binding NarL/FixJ family response regulator
MGILETQDYVALEPNRTTRVWLVDDSDSLRALLASLFREESGINCSHQFSTAEAALEALSHETPPDVILLDVRMPGMGGLRAIRPIKTLAPQTHVVMLTTFYDHGSQQQALADGASALLLKSYTYTRIVEEIRQVVKPAPELALAIPMAELSPERFVESEETLEKEYSGVRSVAPARGHFSWRCASKRFVRGAASLRQRVLRTFRKPEMDQNVVLVGQTAE